MIIFPSQYLVSQILKDFTLSKPFNFYESFTYFLPCIFTKFVFSQFFRWLVPNKGLRTSLSIVETSFRGGIERPELSEAECDIDTLKKLKLGIRSSLWSRPSNNQQHSDYSIAV